MTQDTLEEILDSGASAEAMLQQIYLGVLVIQPSPFCNINCDYCYLPHRTSKARMEMSTLRKTFERIWESGLVGPEFTLLWHAGEPLAVPLSWYEEAFEIIQGFTESKEKVVHSFQTNGTLINERWCDFIADHRLEIGLSIDGPEFIHDFHRKTRSGDGTHAKAMRGAQMLKDRGIPFGVVSVISDKTLDHVDEFYDFFLELGVDGIGLNIEEVEGANESSSLEASGEERVREFLQRLFDRNRAAGFPLRIREFEIARQNIMDPDSNRGPDGEYYNLETNPLSMLNVDCYGNFSTFSPELLGQMTEKWGAFQFGNVMKQTVFEATENAAFQEIYNDILTGNQKCRESCEYYAFCGGASPSNKFYENGTFASGETRHCRSMVQMPMQIVLHDMEKELGLKS